MRLSASIFGGQPAAVKHSTTRELRVPDHLTLISTAISLERHSFWHVSRPVFLTEILSER